MPLYFVVSVISGCAIDDSDRPAPTLRILSYNIHHGEGMDGMIDLERIAAVIKASGSDLVALQEVDKGVKRTDRVDQPSVLAELTGMHVVFEKNINYQGGEYGNAVLSRFPVKRYENHPLPQSIPGEQRGLLEVHVEAEGRAVVFFATHFDYHEDNGERLASADMLRGLVENQRGKAVVVAGDLNARPDSRVIEKVDAYLDDTHSTTPQADPGYTFPANEPDRRIDYILYTPGSDLSAVQSRVIDEAVASDHRPLLVVFELPVN
jgi:endonuclease/exonuclease/phosphatase family metal-dependent hydrolase